MNDAGVVRSHRGQLAAFGRWFAVTLSMTWVAPFAVLAGVVAIIALAGVETADVRREIAAAMLSPDAWSMLSSVWWTFAWICGLCVAVWRVLTIRPELLKTVATKVFRPVELWFAQLPRAARGGVFVLALGALSALMISMKPSPPPAPFRTESSEAPLKPVFDAALSLPDGASRSGKATIEQVGPETFIVNFDVSKPLREPGLVLDKPAK